MSDFQEELTAYIDGELPPEKVRELEAALAKDPQLRALEQRLRRSIDAVEALPLPQTSPALRRAVLAAIEKPTFWEKWFTLPRLLPVGLALAAGLTAVVLWPREEAPALDEEKLLLAQNLEVVEDLDLVDLGSAEDLDVVAQLHELEVTQ
ncbi:MAG: zf-HC2 domain-containing protein [Archangium sp.]|nr:zf-HC2 domain-containing protein [Archangium sp.]